MRLDTSGLDDLVRDMERMGQSSGAVAAAMVQAAVAEIQGAWKESAEKHGLRDTGAMIDSITFGAAPQNIGTALANDVYPQGKDARGVSNATKAFVQNYGRLYSTGERAPTYWVDEAEDLASPRVVATLSSMWESFLATGTVPSAPASSAGSGISTRTK